METKKEAFLNALAEIFSEYEARGELLLLEKMAKCGEAFWSPAFQQPVALVGWIFKSHVREIARRFESLGEKPTAGEIEDLFLAPTRAEILCILSEASFRAPLRSEYVGFMVNTLLDVCDEEGIEIDGLEREPNPMGEYIAEELSNSLRRFKLGEHRIKIIKQALAERRPKSAKRKRSAGRAAVVRL